MGYWELVEETFPSGLALCSDLEGQTSELSGQADSMMENKTSVCFLTVFQTLSDSLRWDERTSTVLSLQMPSVFPGLSSSDVRVRMLGEVAQTLVNAAVQSQGG